MMRALSLAIAVVVMLAPLCTAVAEDSGGFDVSFVAGSRDSAGQLMGGTEIRNLVAHGGRLFAANGYWMETPRGPWTPGPQVLVLDAAGKPWRVDHEFDERLYNGRRRHIAISTLAERSSSRTS